MRAKAESMLSSNSRWTKLSIAAILVIAPIAAGSAANAADFSFTQIDVPGATDTVTNGINDARQIAGHFSDSTGIHGFLDISGSSTQIDVPGIISSVQTGHRGLAQTTTY